MARRAAQDEQAPAPSRNEVLLVGRVAAVAEERELPSGDLLSTFRLVVDRPPGVRGTAGGRPVTIDTLDCSCWAAGVRRTARSLTPGDVVEVAGALRRRFWRAGAAAASRTEVEVSGLRRLVKAAPPAPRPRRAVAQPAVAAADAGGSSS